MMFRTSPPFWQLFNGGGDPGGGYSCPISSYREFTIPTSSEVTYGGDYLNQPPPLAYSANFMYGWIGPSQHGQCWQIGTNTTPMSVSDSLKITINDPTVTKANSIYFEYLGALIVEIDVIDAAGVVTSNYMTGSIDLTLDPNWHAVKFGPAAGQKWIKEIRIRRNGSTSFGLAFVINVKTFCSIGEEFAPMNQDALAIPQEGVPSSITISAPATVVSTSEYVDNLGDVQSAIYYPQDNDGASNYGWCWVVGSPVDSYGTLTITVNNTSVTKYDGFSFESNGAVKIEVWDEYANLAGPPVYTFTPDMSDYGPGPEWGKWNHYRSWPLIHPPIGTHGNIKKIKLTGLDPSDSTPLSSSSSFVKPASIYNVQLFPVNSVNQHTDVGRLVFY